MNGKYRLLFLFVFIIIVWKSFEYFRIFSDKDDDYRIVKINSQGLPQVKISVYYEALCPDSKFFVTYQLLPVYQDFKEYLIVDFVPYGKAKTEEVDGKIVFYCQHEAVECFANKIHSCAIDLVKDPLIRLKYIACMITDNMVPDDAGEKCGQELNIDYTPIGECANGPRGSILLKQYGERTHSLKPPVKFIPTIELNGSQTIVSQSSILKDLRKSLCQILKYQPSKCKG